MKKTTLSLAILALAMGFNSCSNDNENEAAAPKYITVTTQIGSMTRVNATFDEAQYFENGDQISVYAWAGAETSGYNDARVVDNSINTYDGTSWTATPQMLWKNTYDTHYFIALYPKTETSVGDLENFDYTLNVSDQVKSDLLVATNLTGLESSNNPVNLTFSHVMAKIRVKLNFRNQWGGNMGEVSVALKDARTSAKVNCLTKQVIASNPSNLALPSTDGNTEYTSIVVPSDGVKSIIVKIQGKDYTYNSSSDIRLQSGKITNISLNVGRDEITLSSVNIDDWDNSGTDYSGEAQE